MMTLGALVELDDMRLNQFLQELSTTAVDHVATDNYQVSADGKVPADMPVNLHSIVQLTSGFQARFNDTSGVFGYISQVQSSIFIVAAGPKEAVEKVLEKLKVKFPPYTLVPAPDDSVYVNFWQAGRERPKRYIRKLIVPAWDEIQLNYHDTVAQKLDALMKQDGGPESGKIALWHGAPGTGKTFAIRALAKAWKDWCKIEYIIDPDALFGGNASYLVDVLIADVDGGGMPEAIDDELLGNVRKKKRDPWRMLVLEDAGELISHDAKAQTGQGLSRLLNMADGLIGQGINLMILITTNEEITKLNAAVSRSGRCFSKIEFEALTDIEVRSWQERHGKAVTGGTRLLADLYNDVDIISRPKVGF